MAYLPAVHSAPNWKNALIVGWSGLHGSASLAAALAITNLLPNGTHFPYRDLIIFITFSVVLVTLVASGLTLPTLLNVLRVESDTADYDEIRVALRS
jgi:NhaP-type Na+/H+ or K+/H+ antiporter